MGRQMPLTAENRKALPAIRSQEESLDPIVHVKFFNPCGAETWYITEFNAEDGDTMFGFVDGVDFPEFGYISLSELMSVKLRFGLYIERDIHWTPVPLSQATKHFTPDTED